MKNDFDRAIADFSEALKINPRYATAFISRGNAWKNNGNFARAIVDYTMTIEINPIAAEAFTNRGVCYSLLDQSELACLDFQKACDLRRCDELKKAQEQNICQQNKK